MIIPIKAVGAIGLITDLAPNEIPLNAWTAGRNIRFINGVVEKFQGHAEIYATPTWAPYWMLPVATATAYFWLYGGLTKVGATDGASHADITRAPGGDYTVDLDTGWTGTIIENKVVVNNGTDVPQMWTPGLSNKLTALTAWDANWTANAMRSNKRYLVAMDVTKTGTRYPNMVKWSHQAPSNGVPTSWDDTDATIDAGEYELPAEGGFLVDGIPLGDALILYKESQFWLMQYIGGIDIFRFTKKSGEAGMLGRKCAVEFLRGKHVVFTGDDVVLHDGQQIDSIISRRFLNSVVGQIDTAYFQRSFVAVNFAKKEVWVCFPELGNTLCTKALVWNWVENVWGVRDLPNAAFIASGIVDPIASTEIWNTSVGDWSTDSQAWGDRTYAPAAKKMLLAAPSATKFHIPDNTQQVDGTNMTAYVEKTAIGFPLKADAPPDYTTEKLLRGVWPRIRGTQGGIVNVYVGTQERVNGNVSWQAAFPFTIGSTEYVDCLLAAKLHALKFESTSDVAWTLDGYDVDVVPTGQHGSR